MTFFFSLNNEQTEVLKQSVKEILDINRYFNKKKTNININSILIQFPMIIKLNDLNS
jgi:hypothetical protein